VAAISAVLYAFDFVGFFILFYFSLGVEDMEDTN
jgi:hypothetical protein